MTATSASVAQATKQVVKKTIEKRQCLAVSSVVCAKCMRVQNYGVQGSTADLCLRL